MGTTPIERLVAWLQWMRAKPKTCRDCGNMLVVGQGEFCSDEHATAWVEAHAI